MKEPRPSIVPSLQSPPLSPALMVGLFFLAGLLVSAGLLGFVLLASPFVLALPGVEEPSLVRLAGSQAAAGSLALLGVSAYYVSRVEPVYRVLLLGPRDIPRPPSPDSRAVAMAFRWAEHAALFATLGTFSVPLLELLGVVHISGLSGWARIAIALLSMAVTLVGTMPAIVLFRTIVWRWLGRLHPNDVKLPTNDRLGERLAWTVAPPVAGVGIAAVVVLSSHLVALRTRMFPQLEMGGIPMEIDFVAGALASIMILVTTGIAWWLAKRLGDALSQDLIALSERIDHVRHDHPEHDPEHAPDHARERDPERDQAGLETSRAVVHTRAGEQLSMSLAELARRFVEMRGKERKGRRAMEQVQRLRTQFLASMSHDLRSPLNSILGFATLVSSGAEGPVTPEQRESIQMITRSARDLLRLVTNILDSARLEAGRLTLRCAFTPSAEILTQAVIEGRRMIGDRPLEIDCEITAGLPPVYVDQDRIVQAVMGLFSHTIDAVERGTIRLTAKVASGAPGPSSPYLQVDMVDSGNGIREADQETLFQAFREIQEPSGRRIGGLGLGLSVARELIRAHGGEVWCDSVPGKGTTFSVAIPLDPDAPSARPVRIASRSVAPRSV